MRKLKKLILISVFVLLLFRENSFAQQAESMNETLRWQAQITETKLFSNQGITIFEWTQPTVLVEQIGDHFQTRISGRVKEKIRKLFFNGDELKTDATGNFEHKFSFNENIKTFTIRVVDANNKSHFNQYRISASNPVLEQVKPRIFRFNAGAGLTMLTYQQSRVQSFSQWAVTIKGGVNYNLIPDKIDLGLSGFYNLVPFGTTSPKGYKMQYLGLNTRAGYQYVPDPLKILLRFNVGFYFNTSFSEIGFGNMIGPQFYPEATYIFKNGNTLNGYCKFSPALSQDYSISFSENREVAAGVHYSFPFTPLNRMSVGFDVSQLKLSVATSSAVTNTFSLSAGLSF